MFPSPYLASVGPDTAPGTLVYRLSAQRADGSQAAAQFLLVEGEDTLARGAMSGNIQINSTAI